MSKLPQFDSIEQLAHFWQTHDLTDFEGELEEVEETVFDGEARALVSVELPAKDAEKLKRKSQEEGVSQADLVRAWITERLRAS